MKLDILVDVWQCKICKNKEFTGDSCPKCNNEELDLMYKLHPNDFIDTRFPDINDSHSF